MKCSRCGFESPPDTRFCGRCAAPLSSDNPSPTLAGTLIAPLRELATGATFARRYQVIEELGKGGMGRVLEEKGDKAGVAIEYRKFLEYWKDADPAHPELADARRRLAAL